MKYLHTMVRVADLDKSKRFYNDVLGWKPMHDANGIVMYTDDNHLTASFSRSMAPQLRSIAPQGRSSAPAAWSFRSIRKQGGFVDPVHCCKHPVDGLPNPVDVTQPLNAA